MLNKKENKTGFTKQDKKITFAICATLSGIFCMILLTVGVFYFFAPQRTMSQTENRMLEKMPKLSLSSLADGSFMDKFELFLSDQFPLRDKIVEAKTFIERTTGKKEINGVYFGKDGFLFEEQSKYDDKKVKKTVTVINKLAKALPKAKKGFILSPNSSYILSDFMPDGVKQDNQYSQIKKIKNQIDKSYSWIDCVKLFSNVKDKRTLFYRTDHHWTTRAAYLGFKQLMNDWKIDISKNKYNFSAVSNTFQGTLASKAAVENIRDIIEICVPEKTKNTYLVFFEAKGEILPTFFVKDKLNQKNQYEVFLGGNYDKVIINTNRQTKNTLLIIKDSYANCMLPMFTPYFSKIVVIDPRYLSDDISQIIGEYNFTHMLFVCNLNTFLSDNYISQLM